MVDVVNNFVYNDPEWWSKPKYPVHARSWKCKDLKVHCDFDDQIPSVNVLTTRFDIVEDIKNTGKTGYRDVNWPVGYRLENKGNV